MSLPNNVQTLGEAIRHLREERGMTLRALAQAVGVTAPFLSDVEHNRRKTDKLPELAKALGVKVEVLREFDGRLTGDLKDWLAAKPALVRLLEDIRASGREPQDLRDALFRKKR